MRYRQAEPLANLEKMLRNSNKNQIRNTLEASLVAQMVKNLPAMQEARVPSLGHQDLLAKGMATIPVFLPGESHGQRSLAGYSPWQFKELDRTEGLTFHIFISKTHSGKVKQP